jgi:hypothetical protein
MLRLQWQLLAFTGATTADMLQRLREEPAAKVDVVLTSLGVKTSPVACR